MKDRADRINVFHQMISDILLWLISDIPGRTGHRVRYLYWRRRLKSLGKNVKIEVGVYLNNPGFISIDDNCWIDRGVIILAGPDTSSRSRRKIANDDFPLSRGEVHIGKNVHVAPYSILSGIGGLYVSDNCSFSAGVRVYSLSHNYRSDEQPWNREVYFCSRVADEFQFLIEGPVYLAENVGVALNAVLLPGVSIGRDSFIAINSVVAGGRYEENSLLSGQPAEKTGLRYPSSKKHSSEPH